MAILPSSVIAAFTVTKGVRWTIQWLNASFSRAASVATSLAASAKSTFTPALRNISNPLPAWLGLGSVVATTTRRMPAARIASVQGGVRPCVQQGSSVT